jgi:hypothetical protein
VACDAEIQETAVMFENLKTPWMREQSCANAIEILNADGETVCELTREEDITEADAAQADAIIWAINYCANREHDGKLL